MFPRRAEIEFRYERSQNFGRCLTGSSRVWICLSMRECFQSKTVFSSHVRKWLFEEVQYVLL